MKCAASCRQEAAAVTLPVVKLLIGVSLFWLQTGSLLNLQTPATFRSIMMCSTFATVINYQNL